jgi:hypothetical protein
MEMKLEVPRLSILNPAAIGFGDLLSVRQLTQTSELRRRLGFVHLSVRAFSHLEKKTILQEFLFNCF